MTNLRKSGIIAAILGLALALPTGALAAQTSGTSPENLTVASTISATFPALQVYGGDGSSGIAFAGGPNYETPEGLVTIVGSNNATGITITAQAAVYDGPGAIEVPTTGRKGAVSGYSGVGSGAALNPAASTLAAGTFASPATIVTIASSDGPVAGRQVGINWAVSQSLFTVAGEYTSSITYVASTNP